MKKLKQVFIASIMAFITIQSSQLFAQTQNWSLLSNSNGSADEYMQLCTRGPLGNLFYGGTHQGPFTIDGNFVKHYPAMFVNSFIGHRSANGAHNWALPIGGKSIMFASTGGLTADPFGNVFFRVNCFGGVIGDTIYIGPNYFKRLTNNNSIVLIVKMDSLGNVLWTNEINAGATNPGSLNNLEMKSDANGDVYIAGFFYEPQNFDSIRVLPVGQDANFLAKCSASGNFLWARSFGSKSGDGQQISINLNNQNEVFLSGGWEGDSLFIDGQFVVNPAPGGFFSTDRYIAKFNSSGALQWLKREGGLDSDDFATLVLMPNGDVICQSYMGSNPLTVNNNQIITGGPTWLHTKYDNQGNFKSYEKIAIPVDGNAHLETDGKDLFLLKSFNTPQITYGNIALTNSAGTLGTYDIALFKLDTMYNVKWGLSFGSTEDEFNNAMIYSNTSGIIIGGSTSSSQLIIGPDTLNNLGSLTNDGFLLAVDVKNVGISSYKKSSNISYYPNPAKDLLNIDFDDAGQSPIELKVLNSIGQVVINQTTEASKKIQLDIKNLKKGIYLLEIKMEKNYSLKKFIKE